MDTQPCFTELLYKTLQPRNMRSVFKRMQDLGNPVKRVIMNNREFGGFRKAFQFLDDYIPESLRDNLKKGEMGDLWGARIVTSRECEEGTVLFQSLDNSSHAKISVDNSVFCQVIPIGTVMGVHSTSWVWAKKKWCIAHVSEEGKVTVFEAKESDIEYWGPVITKPEGFPEQLSSSNT